MAEEKNAPEAEAGKQNRVEGQSTTIPEEENEMSHQDTTALEHAATHVATVLAEIDASEHGYIDIEPADPLYREIAPSFRKPVESLDGPLEDFRGWTHMVYPIDADGRKVELPGGIWWREKIAEHRPDVVRYWKRNANTAIRVGGLLVISLGEYTPVGGIDENGEVEFVMLDELRRRADVAKDAWEAEHADVIKAAMPAEATTFEVWDFDGPDRSVGVLYEREIGPVTLSWSASVEGGCVTRIGTAPSVLVEIGNKSDEVGGVAEMRELVSALTSAIALLEEMAA